MALDPRYVTSKELESLFVNKTTGALLAGGSIWFYQDDARAVPKNVYQLTGAPPNYTYTALPNPVLLSAVGTPMDNAGNNVAIYYLPYDSLLPTAEIQLYYVVVKDAAGNVQFTREGWPNTSASDNSSTAKNNIANLLSNSQFADILFIPGQTLTITIAGAGDTSVQIAQDWTLNITTNGASQVTVTQTPIAGSAQLPTNPPYTLDFVAGNNITALKLTQTLLNNPDIWSPALAGANGYMSASIVAGAGTALSIDYKPSGSAAQRVLDVNNILGTYQEYGNTVKLNPATNPDNGNVGTVDININLPLLGASSITSVQAMGLESNITGVTYDQEPTNRQRDHLAHYYNPLLQFKPIPSYLIGWDFPLNPAQFLTSTVAAIASGNNTSNYIWDQTIVFQSLTSGVSFSRAASGALRATMAIGNQIALIQYLQAPVARNILHNQLSVMISALTGAVAGFNGTVSLWYTTDANLPAMGGNASLVATLTAQGKPATFNGTWHEVPRNGSGASVSATSLLGDATFTIGTSATTKFNNYGFSGWDLQGNAAANTATFFAIVVGTAAAAVNASIIDFNSISLVPGLIPTLPAPQDIGEVYRECTQFYNSSFEPNVLPATAVGLNTGCITWNTTRAGVQPNHAENVWYHSPMRAVPTMTFYNPVNNNAQGYDTQVPGDLSGTTAITNNRKSFSLASTGNVGGSVGDLCEVHFTADARLGIVN